MNEDKILELISYLKSFLPKQEPFESRLEEYRQAIKWAEMSEKWDLVVELTDILSYRFAFSQPSIREENEKTITEEIMNFWKQGKEFSIKGQNVAKQIGNQDAEVKFLKYLTRIGVLMEDFDLILSCMNQRVNLATKEEKWGLAYELGELGRHTKQPNRFLTASTLLHMSSSIFEELDDKAAVADALFFLGQIELEQEHLSTAKQFFGRSIEAGMHSNYSLSVIRSLEELGKTYQLEGDINQAEITFREALSIIDDHPDPSIYTMRESLERALASLSL